METRKKRRPYPAELRERAVRLVREHEAGHGSQWAAGRYYEGLVEAAEAA